MTNQETYQFPATPTQKALWFIHRMNPASAAYNIPLAFRVRGLLNEAALRDAFSALVARHEILRTVFAEREGTLVQIARAVGLLDWRTDSPADVPDTDVYCRAAAARHVALPFDLETGPLLRVRLERLSDSDALLVAVFRHIVIEHLSLAQCAE